MGRLPKHSEGDGEKHSPECGDREVNPDQRGTLLRHLQLIRILEKIPLFQGLTTRQFKEVIRACERRSFCKDEIIFRAGDESWEIFILLQGALKVAFPDGKELSRIEPVGIAGEMGVFTGERRSATIITATPCILLALHKMELLRLLRHDAELGIRVLLNVILDLSRKLRRDNQIIQELKQLCPPGASTGIIRKKQDG